jgi:hypothetical protein
MRPQFASTMVALAFAALMLVLAQLFTKYQAGKQHLMNLPAMARSH